MFDSLRDGDRSQPDSIRQRTSRISAIEGLWASNSSEISPRQASCFAPHLFPGRRRSFAERDALWRRSTLPSLRCRIVVGGGKREAG